MNETTVNATSKKTTLFAELKSLPWLYKILACLPILGISFGGAIGGALAVGNAYGVVAVAKKEWSTPIKLLAIFGIYTVTSIIFVVLATVISLAFPH